MSERRTLASCDTNAIFRWRESANTKWFESDTPEPKGRVFKRPLPQGFMWVCDDEFGYRPTIEEAKSRAEATCRHRQWYGARRREEPETI